jgi:phosphohistidine phosphatase SixA
MQILTSTAPRAIEMANALAEAAGAAAPSHRSNLAPLSRSHAS